MQKLHCIAKHPANCPLLTRTHAWQVHGPPGNAFELVYGGVTDRVRQNMHAADPALGEWIRWAGNQGGAAPFICWTYGASSRPASLVSLAAAAHAGALLTSASPSRIRRHLLPPCRPRCRLHLYGDLYSSPGLDLRQKQLLTCAFLAEAAMPDQLFGHSLAGLRWGAQGGREGRVSGGGVRKACSTVQACSDLATATVPPSAALCIYNQHRPPCCPGCRRFGNSYEALEAVARLACEMGPRTTGGGPGSKEAVLKSSLQMLDMVSARGGICW